MNEFLQKWKKLKQRQQILKRLTHINIERFFLVPLLHDNWIKLKSANDGLYNHLMDIIERVFNLIEQDVDTAAAFKSLIIN